MLTRRPLQLNTRRRLAAALAGLLLAAACGGAGAGTPAPGSALVIANKGSDTMVNLALAWAEAYAVVAPEVTLSVTGGGSGTGLAALFNGTNDLANASRPISAEELASAEAAGQDPEQFIVARDAIAIIVHPDNPVQALTLPQLSDMYSGKLTNWQQVGGEDRPIVLLSRETNSGTHVYFLEHVLRLGDGDSPLLFSPDTLLLPSSEGIGAEVRQNPNAIGYDGLGYVTDDMQTVAVAATDGAPYVLPTIATVNDGTYPIARDLYMYTLGAPSGAVAAYLEWVLSPPAQQIVADLGFVPVQ